MKWETLMARSYVPYSGKPGACLVKGRKNIFYPGIRIENIAFPDTIDEIQAAIFTCLAEGDVPQQLVLPENTSGHSDLLHFWEKEYDLEHIITNDISNLNPYENMLSSDIDVRDTLTFLLDMAVVPNSHFPVSSLLKTPDGYISGVNVECSEWRLGLCAERLSIAKALAMGYTDLNEIFIHTRYGEFSSPCGACRQVIVEHMPHKPVHLFHANGTESYHNSSHLLPYSFQSKSLHKEIKSN